MVIFIRSGQLNTTVPAHKLLLNCHLTGPRPTSLCSRRQERKRSDMIEQVTCRRKTLENMNPCMYHAHRANSNNAHLAMYISHTYKCMHKNYWKDSETYSDPSTMLVITVASHASPRILRLWSPPRLQYLEPTGHHQRAQTCRILHHTRITAVEWNKGCTLAVQYYTLSVKFYNETTSSL